MSDTNDTPQLQFIHSQGWADCIEAQLLSAHDDWKAPQFRSHWHTLRRLFEDIHIDAVLCIKSRPTVCLINATQLEDVQIEETRKKLWNLGATTLLVAERAAEVQVFSTLAKPSKNDPNGTAALLEGETIEDLRDVELALRVQQLVRRVETGAIYRDEYKPLFDPKKAVDRLLLENLKAARDLMCPQKSVAEYQRAHALIGKFLFSCYLLDRGIIGRAYLKQNSLPEATDMLELLVQQDRQLIGYGYTLDELFQSLQRDFNGNLFSVRV